MIKMWVMSKDVNLGNGSSTVWEWEGCCDRGMMKEQRPPGRGVGSELTGRGQGVTIQWRDAENPARSIDHDAPAS